jgi:hypothetical protein
MTSVAGKPQNKAESPRASWPSERSNSALGDVIGEMMKEERRMEKQIYTMSGELTMKPHFMLV